MSRLTLFAVLAGIHWLSYVSLVTVVIAAYESVGGEVHAGIRVMEVAGLVLGTPLMHLMWLQPSAFGSTPWWWGDDINLIIIFSILNSMVWAATLTSVWHKALGRLSGTKRWRG